MSAQGPGSGWYEAPGGPPGHYEPGPWSPPQPPTGNPSKYCHACGAVIDARAEICPRCGVRQISVAAGPGPVATGPGKDRALAILLALLLGSLGIHRFYLGQVAWGILYLVFSWTGIPGIIAWFEALYFLTRSNEDWAREYGGPVRVPNSCAMGCLWALALWPLLAIAAIVLLMFLSLQIDSILTQIGNEM